MNINLLTPINQLGYGIAGLNVFERLSADNQVALFPIGQAEPPDSHRLLVDHGKSIAGQFDERAPSLRIWHQFGLAEHVGRGKRVGFPFFELRQLTAAEKHHLNHLDAVVVPSEWAKSVCVENGITRPVSVAPLGVDRQIFHEEVGHDRLDPDHTVFINVGKWEYRKGHDVLLTAFNKAFEPSDKVILKMLAANQFIGRGNDKWAKQYATTRMSGRIVVHRHRLDTQGEVAAFMAAADAAVFPSRGEAWNLDLLEAMACGLHCIATDYAGHTAYVNHANCRLIEVYGYEIADDGVFFSGAGEWAWFGPDQEDQLIGHLRDIHRQKQTGRLPRRNAAAIATTTEFTWQRTADMLKRTMTDG